MTGPPPAEQLLADRDAVSAPCWAYVTGSGGRQVVTFAGASKTPAAVHPLCYGSSRSHLFVFGTMTVRPLVVVGTDAMRGEDLGDLLAGDLDVRRMLRDGEKIAGTDAALRHILTR